MVHISGMQTILPIRVLAFTQRYFQNSSGCDSIVQLDLTIYNKSFSSTSVVACDQYNWALTGLTYNTSGQSRYLTKSNLAADSIVRLNL